jgi:hypothetical protein
MLFEPDGKVRKRFQIVYVNSSRSHVAACPLHRSAAGVQKVGITESRGYELGLAGHTDDEHCSVDEGEQVTGHLSMDNSSDGDSIKCPICSVTFTTQEVDTRHLRPHILCCLPPRMVKE